MSQRYDIIQKRAFRERLRNPTKMTDEELLVSYRKAAEEIRQSGLPRIVSIKGEIDVWREIEGLPWTGLPDEATMKDMIQEAAKCGLLPYWTHWTPSVRYRSFDGKLPLPTPIIFDGLFMGYDWRNRSPIA